MRRFGILAWTLALVVALATVLLGAGTGRAQAGAATPNCILLCPPTTTTTVPRTTTTTVPPTTTTLPPTTTTRPTTTTTTVASGAPPIGAGAQPCAAPRPGDPCTEDPAQLDVIYNPALGVTGVQLGWVPQAGRPSGAPAPEHASVVLPVTSAQACAPKPPAPAGSVATCWAWPAAIKYTRPSQAWTLNGTYQVTACSGSTKSDPCVSSRSYTPTRFGLAAPPSPPSKVVATTAYGGTVSVQWAPAANPEPDLTGYSVSRGSRTIFSCSTDGVGPGAGTPCPSPLATTDNPPSGLPTYSVQALRFGATTDQLVLSFPRSSKLNSLTSTVGSGNDGGGTVSFNLPAAPGLGSADTVPLVNPPPSAAAHNPVTALPGVPSTDLPYDNGALGTAPGASGSHQNAVAIETAPRNPNLDSLASVAAGMILLALAAHVWYLRGEMAGAAARIAARRKAAASRS